MVNSPIDEIKDRLDIVDIVKGYVKLEKAGVNYRALCPFHSEKTPSFFVSPSRQIWHCFGGCGKGGDIFKFIMEVEGVEFNDALRILAAKAGVELKKQDPKIKTERQRIYEICELATRFFEKKLKEPSVKKVEEYLTKRGINQESIEKWRLGYSPDSWDELIGFLENKDYFSKEIEKAGLVVKKEGTNRYYDRFRGRIMFPVFDFSSQPIGFGGRIFNSENEKQAKYLNTPNTLIYDKSKILYGLDRARSSARKKDFFVLVEGYTDVIMSHQAGIENVVATSGTALTPYQLKVLKRYCNNLVIAFDMDVAGDSATKRGIELAQENDFNIKVALMPEGLDPADLILKDEKSWEKILNKSVSIVSFYFKTAFSQFDSSVPENKKKIARMVLPIIKKIDSDIEKDYWIKKLAEKLEVSEKAVIQDLVKVKGKDREAKESDKTVLPKKQIIELLEERFLALIIKDKEKINLLDLNDFSFFSDKTQEIINYFKDEESKKIPASLKERIDYLVMKSEVELEGVDCEKEIVNCLSEIKNIVIKRKLNQISLEIKNAEKDKNFDKSEKLKKEFNSYCKKLSDIN